MVARELTGGWATVFTDLAAKVHEIVRVDSSSNAGGGERGSPNRSDSVGDEEDPCSEHPVFIRRCKTD